MICIYTLQRKKKNSYCPANWFKKTKQLTFSAVYATFIQFLHLNYSLKDKTKTNKQTKNRWKQVSKDRYKTKKEVKKSDWAETYEESSKVRNILLCLSHPQLPHKRSLLSKGLLILFPILKHRIPCAHRMYLTVLIWLIFRLATFCQYNDTTILYTHHVAHARVKRTI